MLAIRWATPLDPTPAVKNVWPRFGGSILLMQQLLYFRTYYMFVFVYLTPSSMVSNWARGGRTEGQSWVCSVVGTGGNLGVSGWACAGHGAGGSGACVYVSSIAGSARSGSVRSGQLGPSALTVCVVYGLVTGQGRLHWGRTEAQAHGLSRCRLVACKGAGSPCFIHTPCLPSRIQGSSQYM